MLRDILYFIANEIGYNKCDYCGRWIKRGSTGKALVCEDGLVYICVRCSYFGKRS